MIQSSSWILEFNVMIGGAMSIKFTRVLKLSIFVLLVILSSIRLVSAAPPTISGVPQKMVTAGSSYSFMPSINNATSVNITGKPSWVSFYASSDNSWVLFGGTPFRESVGTYDNIIITATNSEGSVSLPPFSITVAPAPITAGSGTVKFLSFEGGFYGIVDDNGTSYDPIMGGLPQEYCIDGLHISYTLMEYAGILTYHMWGTPVEVLSLATTGLTSGGGTAVPVMEDWWMLPGMLAGVGIFARKRKERK